MNSEIDIFFIGPAKTASTWIYHVLNEHPETEVAKSDCTHLFNIHYNLNFQEHFQTMYPGTKKKLRVDMSQDYLTSVKVPERIKIHNPKAKVIMCIRNPIDRAFSHYWHLKKKNSINYSFEDVLTTYETFSQWIEPGFYSDHLERFESTFEKNNILVLFYDDLLENPKAFLSQIYKFLNIDQHFVPSVLNQRINEAGHKKNASVKIIQKIGNVMTKIGLYKLFIWLKSNNVDNVIKDKISTKGEYTEGINPEMKAKLAKIYSKEIKIIEHKFKRNLKNWII